MIPLDAEPDEAFKAEAMALMLAGLGKAELEVVASYTAPLFWILRDSEQGEAIKGGSMFCLDTGQRVFGVTAAHVAQECLNDTRLGTFVRCLVGNRDGSAIPISLGDRLIDGNPEIDIATFLLEPAEIAQCGIQVLRGYNRTWPPPLPQLDRGVTYCGFPGLGRRRIQPSELACGMAALAGICSSTSDTSISVLIERENMMQVFGEAPMPEDFNFGGISGGLMLAIVQTPTIRSWMPAGVIIQGPNPSGVSGEAIAGLEIIKARPMHFIKPDGLIDVTRWQQVNF